MKTVFRISSLLLLVLFAVLLTGTAAFADDSSDLPFMVGDQEVNTTTRSSLSSESAQSYIGLCRGGRTFGFLGSDSHDSGSTPRS